MLGSIRFALRLSQRCFARDEQETNVECDERSREERNGNRDSSVTLVRECPALGQGVDNTDDRKRPSVESLAGRALNVARRTREVSTSECERQKSDGQKNRVDERQEKMHR